MIFLARRALEELASRAHVATDASATPARLEDFRATLFRKQREVLGCPSRKVAVLCTRRAGKTTLVPAALFAAAERNPGCVVPFIGRTRERARELAWENLKRANDDYRLGYRTNDARLTLRHPTNGAEIRLYGADNLREIEKRRGDKVAEAYVDEAQSFPDDVLRTLVEDVLWPSLLDVSGRLTLLGTPGYVCAGLWHELTRNEDEKSRSARAPGWEVFEWSGLDNPSRNHKGERICDLFALELRTQLADPARGPTHATVIREYLGRWTNDLASLYYSFDPARNTWPGGALPTGHEWRRVMGVDLGKAYANVTWAVSPTHPVVYEVAGKKVHDANANRWRAETQTAIDALNPDVTVVDYGGLGRGVVDAWQEDGLPVEDAEKHHKDAFVALMNAELEAGRVKALAGGALAQEWSTLPKDPDSPPGKPPQPKAGFEDHSSDAGLYAWRKARVLVGAVDSPAPAPGSEAARALAEQQEKERFMRQRHGREEEW